MAGSEIYAGSEFQQTCRPIAETPSWSKTSRHKGIYQCLGAILELIEIIKE